jgi:predicted DNA-binding transcriptional regulator AlpA
MAKHPERLNTSETAAFLGVAVKTLRNKLASRTEDLPPYYRVFGKLVWDKSDVEKWLSARRVQNESVTV